jgi:hypothetical protein
LVVEKVEEKKFSYCLSLNFQSIFLLIVTQLKPTLPSITVTDLAVTVDGSTNHCRKKLVKSFSFSDFTDFLVKEKNFYRSRPMLNPKLNDRLLFR